MTTNIVEAVLDREKLKWDAFWHLFKWLLKRDEGHNLGSEVLDKLCMKILGQHFREVEIHPEFQLSNIPDGKGKWADLVVAIPSFKEPSHIILMDDVDKRSPNSMRKIDNLLAYQTLAQAKFPLAKVRVVVLTNAQNGTSMTKLYETLKEEATDFNLTTGWKLLPLSEVGNWVQLSLNSTSTSCDKTRLFLEDFVAWSQSLN